MKFSSISSSFEGEGEGEGGGEGKKLSSDILLLSLLRILSLSRGSELFGSISAVVNFV